MIGAESHWLGAGWASSTEVVVMYRYKPNEKMLEYIMPVWT